VAADVDWIFASLYKESAVLFSRSRQHLPGDAGCRVLDFFPVGSDSGVLL
jgi:hypothetical protein